ncbi:thioredoxin family protein [Sphingobacterium faecale]|uniref:Thioredoxin family protein n=1 Tax=Sphingobacterium faecale TaxID=2803775 RepID=A0ABS1QZC4_9SPHI|nr:thioredoxin family protein [Sphingobacterium faecale]MBL1407550.1 thioredoxin family protein [Sphingobacterium faecale]
MKRLTTILAGTFILAISFAKAQGIHFEDNFNIALEKAKRENKMIFVDFYTSWCGPCKAMSADVFPQKEAGDFFNSQFVNVKVQCDDKGEGVELGKKYNIMAYPTLMFLDQRGNLVHSTAGGQSVKGLIKLAKIAADPTKNQLAMINKWNSGNREPEFLINYFQNLTRSYQKEKATADFEKYFDELSAKEKTSRNTIELMKIVQVAPFTVPFTYLEEHKNEYYKNNIAPLEIDSLIASQYLGYLKSIHSTASTQQDRDAFDQKMAQFKAKNYPYYEEYASFYHIFDAKDATGAYDIRLYIERGTEFLNQYGKNNDAYTISLTSLLGNLTGRKNQSPEGIKWMEDLLSRTNNSRYLQTYFYITWRNHQWDKALEIAEDIKRHAISNNASTSDVDTQIQMIKDLKIKYGG